MAIWFPHKPSSRMQKLVIYWSLFTAAGCMCVWEGFKRHIVTCIIFSCSLALGQLDSTQFNVMLRKLASCTVAEVFGTVPELHRCNGAASDWEKCLMLPFLAHVAADNAELGLRGALIRCSFSEWEYSDAVWLLILKLQIWNPERFCRILHVQVLILKCSGSCSAERFSAKVQWACSRVKGLVKHLIHWYLFVLCLKCSYLDHFKAVKVFVSWLMYHLVLPCLSLATIITPMWKQPASPNR